jgi:hypothetical protein
VERSSKCVKKNYTKLLIIFITCSLLIVSNQSTKVFPPDFFQNKKDTKINKNNEKSQSNFSPLKEKKVEDHDFDEDRELLNLLKGKGKLSENNLVLKFPLFYYN